MTTSAAVSHSAAVRQPATAAAKRWQIDASHSSVGFSVRHMMITNVKGQFEKLEGEVTYDPTRPEAASVRASIDVASISTREEKRDAHLRSADFFDVEQFPTIEFQSRGTTRKGSSLEVAGDLSIHGTTRAVVLTVSDLTEEHVDPWGNLRIGASATTKVKRSDFGMQWNSALEAGGVLVGDEVTIQIEVSLVRSK
jgi:polyisoprenoid-binding protein YceI